MRYIILFLFIFVPVFSFAEETEAPNPPTEELSQKQEDTTLGSLKNLLLFQDKDPADRAKFEQAKENLQQKPFVKMLEFLYQKKKDGFNIHIDGEEDDYVLPLFVSFNSSKRSVGLALESGNILKKGQDFYLSFEAGKNLFSTHNEFAYNKNTFILEYNYSKFNQKFYQDGWESDEAILYSEAKKELYKKVKTKKEDMFFSYRYQISNLWEFFITPEYEYYKYQDSSFDSGNHSHFSFGAQYTDNVPMNIYLGSFIKLNRQEKKAMLVDLPRIKRGKLATISYTYGSKWTGSDYEIQKLALSGNYMLEFKTRHRLALFAKTQQAYKAPFSNLIESSDMLFGLGIYDREQRGKRGYSFGSSFTYFLMRKKAGLLSLMPFYEQAFINSADNHYTSHSGAGAILTYQFLHIYLPISLNYTYNLSDFSHHVGFKIGGHF